MTARLWGASLNSDMLTRAFSEILVSCLAVEIIYTINSGLAQKAVREHLKTN